MIPEQSLARVESLPLQLARPVRLVLFTTDTGCPLCPAMLELARAIKARSSKIGLELYDLVMDRDKSEQYGIQRVPALVVQSGDGQAVTFYGLVEGILLDVLLTAITTIADQKRWFSGDVRRALQHLTNTVQVRVFVESDCSLCRPVTETAIGLALESGLISVSIIAADDFPELIRKYHVATLPKTIFGENLHMDGHVTEGEFLEMVFQAEGVRPGPERRCLVCGTASPDIICMNCRTRIQAEAVEHKRKGERLGHPESF